MGPLRPDEESRIDYLLVVYNGFVNIYSGRGAGVARTLGVGEAGGSIPLVPTNLTMYGPNTSVIDR